MRYGQGLCGHGRACVVMVGCMCSMLRLCGQVRVCTVMVKFVWSVLVLCGHLRLCVGSVGFVWSGYLYGRSRVCMVPGYVHVLSRVW